MNKPTLAARRAELIERCAEQRVSLAYELQSLRPANVLDHPVAGFVAGHRKLVLAGASAVLGLLLARSTRLAGLLGAAVSGAKVARNLLGFLARHRR